MPAWIAGISARRMRPGENPCQPDGVPAVHTGTTRSYCNVFKEFWMPVFTGMTQKHEFFVE
jgi:hypothetical protein